ncbi:MAG: alpha/beta hydrolase [Lysobacteraceae bacterium]
MTPRSGQRRPGIARRVLRLVGLLALAYAAWLGLLYLQQRPMLFPGTGLGPALAQARLPDGASLVTLEAGFGHVLAIHLTAAVDDGPAPALIYFHGNAETALHNVAAFGPVAADGVQVLIVEYPGYAGTDGRPGRDSLEEAARLGFDWLAAQPGVDPGRILAVGRSIGSGPAASLAAERPVAGVVLFAPFSSLATMARAYGAPALLLRDRFDNRAAIYGYTGPVRVVHGTRDRIIPFRHGEAVAAAADDGALWAMDCGHNDCPFLGREVLQALTRLAHAEPMDWGAGADG